MNEELKTIKDKMKFYGGEDNVLKRLIEIYENHEEDSDEWFQDCAAYILKKHEQLQQENKKLKKQYSKLEDKYFKNVPCCNEDDCLLYKRYFDIEIILTEFEKWLEEDFTNEVEHPTPQIYCNCYSCKIKALDKLQELKEGNRQWQ